MNDRARVPVPGPSPYQADLLVTVARERTILSSGFLAGLCVFFAPLAILACGLLAAYVASLVNEGQGSIVGVGRPLTRADFRAVFAPAVDEAPLLLSAGLLGVLLAQFRRWLFLHAEAANLAFGRRPFFREFAFIYGLLVSLALGVAATHGGWTQVERLLRGAPAFLLLMLCATWLAQAVWSYCFRNIIELLASGPEREAAAALARPGRRLKTRGSHA